MSFQEDKNQLIEYITQGMRYSENEQELEEFSSFWTDWKQKPSWKHSTMHWLRMLTRR